MKHLTIKTIFISTIASILLIGAGCNNNKGRGNNTAANMGALPTVNCLLSPNNSQGFCNYSYGNYYGFSNYDHTMVINGLNNNYATGFCGCGQDGTRFPVYNNNWGLGCVSNSALPTTQGYGTANYARMLMFSWNAQARQWTTYQQYQQPNYYGGASCSTYSVILACDTGAQGSCGPNGSCMALNGGIGGGNGGYAQSTPGVCVLNQYNNTGYYNNGYNSGYNNGLYNNGYNNGYYNNGYTNGYYNNGYTGY